MTAPLFVPKAWDLDVDLGAPGFVVCDRQTSDDEHVGLALAAWDVDTNTLERLVDRIEMRKNTWPMRSGSRLRTLLERLIPVASGDDAVHELAYAAGIREAEALVSGFEEAFRGGHDFTETEHARIQQLLQELVMRKDEFSVHRALATERLGLESRLVRLLDAQASRDASSGLERVLSALTSLVLVPGVVAGVFGANVPLPFQDMEEMRWAMFALMASAGTMSFLALTGLTRHAATRSLTLRWPGAWNEPGKDRSWRARLGFAALAGAAFGIVWLALDAMIGAPVAMEQSTTFAVVTLSGVALIAVVLVLAWRDVRERSWRHARYVLTLAVTFAWLSRTVMLSHAWEALVGLAVLSVVALATLSPGGKRRLAEARRNAVARRG